MRTLARILSTATAVLTATALTGCGDTPPTTPDTDTTVTTAAPTSEPPAAATSQAEPAEQPAERWVMPDLVGGGLQDAQDQIQALTGNPAFLTLSHDLSGQKRNQVKDANWQVCAQNVAPGAPVTKDSVIDFGVVKTTESCP